MTKAPAALKRLMVGRPMSSGELEHTLLPKSIALPVFASDALSSVSYATQEILIVLSFAGALALSNVVPISLAVAALMAIVIVSYRQTVRAYPQGGGAYRVSHENLGTYPSLFAASALLIDYVMTVAVSITAGVDAITTAAPGMTDYEVLMGAGFIAFVTLMNLRGTKESGLLFAIPTYCFILVMMSLLVTGFAKCLDGCPVAESANLEIEPHQALSLFLILRAFTAGSSALTGVEAISDGVPAFRYPQSRNAATTLALMGAIGITMFLGISILADLTGVQFLEHGEHQRTVLGQVAAAVFGEGLMFYVAQVATAAILILAANTAYADFPRLSSILAQDRFMPRQFMNRGDRLVFSNGIVILAIFAISLIWIFDADLNRLIQLYLVGVFVSFTLSQSGMVAHWRKTREPGWRKSAMINGFGATVTGVVLVVVILTKFTQGAWIVITAQPILMFVMLSIKRHYEDVKTQLTEEERRPTDRRPGNQHMVIYVRRCDVSVARAIGYVRSVRPGDVTAVTFDDSVRHKWADLAPDIRLEVVRHTGSDTASLRRFLGEVRSKNNYTDDDFLTVVIPEILKHRSLLELIRRPALHRLKAVMLTERGVQVMDVPVVEGKAPTALESVPEPTRNHVLILVSGIHNATLQAVEYAETLSASDIRCVSFGLDPEQVRNLSAEWLDSGIPHPLEIEDSPFRDIGLSLQAYLRQFGCDGVQRVVTVVLPEFVVSKRRHQVLHGQTALLVKRHLIFEPGIVTVSVPYHLYEEEDAEDSDTRSGERLA
ncbi:MAG: APC family permease [Actinomycetota bacterium]